MLFLQSSFIIPTLNSGSVLSDPLLHAGDSCALGRDSHLFPSRGDRVQEIESLLPCLQGLSPDLSQYHSQSILNIHEGKKKAKWNFNEGAELQVNVPKS